MDCRQCGGRTTPQGVIRSGNSNYRINKCNDCGAETMECTGLS